MYSAIIRCSFDKKYLYEFYLFSYNRLTQMNLLSFYDLGYFYGVTKKTRPNKSRPNLTRPHIPNNAP